MCPVACCRNPIIIKACKTHLDTEHGFHDVDETDLRKDASEFAGPCRRPHKTGATPINSAWIDCSDCVPKHASGRLAAKIVPHRSRYDPAGTDNAPHFENSAFRIGHKMQDEHRECTIELAVRKFQLAGVTPLNVDPRVGVALARRVNELLFVIDGLDRGDVCVFSQRKCQASGPAAYVEDAVPHSSAGKINK